MQTKLAPEFQNTPDGLAAEAILRKCVHCGFCTATCPTYQLLGDELDGPRGRIYLIKQVMEGATPTRATQSHLDRCLTCRNCESTCPSGVPYGQLVEIGRRVVDAKVPRPTGEKLQRWALKEGLTSPLFKTALALGQAARPLVPAALADKLPAGETPPRAHQWPQRPHTRKMLLLTGCVQPAMAPNINSATARVLDACGIQLLVEETAGCCGAIRDHLGDHDGGLADMRRNIDAWWPHIATGKVEGIIVNASGCSLMTREYGHALRHDPAYAEKAARISALTHDLSELLPELLPTLKRRLQPVLQVRAEAAAARVVPDGVADRKPPKAPPAGARAAASPQLLPGGGLRPVHVAFHPPCTLQHGLKLRGGVEAALREIGFEVSLAACDSHLCCGSAGTYSVLQPELSKQLRGRKLEQLGATGAPAIVSANIGCISHLQAGTATPVRHWVEVVDDLLAESASSLR
jgi:glycolate oxidase iron-sulfur subunit